MASEANRRIAKNTVMLYIRMLFSMVVSLYTARVILNTLGVEDYGTYNVVGGIVTLFGFINASLATGTQRFLTFELSKGDTKKLNRIFCMSLNIHVIIAIIVFLLAETVGLWFLNVHLVIPTGRIDAANWVYQFSVLTAMISTTQVPYSASIVSHERFTVYAYVGITEVLLRLVIVLLLVIIKADKLVLFAGLSFFISAGIALYYRAYCNKKFQECKYSFIWDKPLSKTLLSFSGWSLLGNTSHILLNQGTNILVNLFFGVTVNAARAITVQVENALNSFVTNFMVAMNPQITKNYAANNFEEMKTLMQRGAKFSFFIFFFMSLPVFLEIELILKVWLKSVPEYTATFIRLNLIVMLIYTLTNSYYTGIFATGNIKRYQSWIASMVAVLFLLTYLLLKLGHSPEITYIVYIVISIFVLIFRIVSVKRLIGFSIKDYFQNVILKITLVAVVSCPLPTILSLSLPESFSRVIQVGFSAVLITTLSIMLFGLTNSERNKIISILNTRFERLRHNL